MLHTLLTPVTPDCQKARATVMVTSQAANELDPMWTFEAFSLHEWSPEACLWEQDAEGASLLPLCAVNWPCLGPRVPQMI